MIGKLVFKDGSIFEGESFGALLSRAGEVVFNTGMVGYPESLTDASYVGQILILTYPLIGNYGVPDKKYWESDSIKISGLIVSNYINTPSHFQSRQTLSSWLKKSKVPALEIKDTRFLTQKIREKGVMLGKIVINKNISFYDPNKDNLVALVSTKKIIYEPPLASPSLTWQGKTVILVDCGTKRNIIRSLLKRHIKVITVPWDFDPFENTHLGRWRSNDFDSSEVNKFDGIVISNGPGDPKMAKTTIATVKKALAKNIPTLGICLGHQLLALAAGGDTYKLKFGHRSQNQPCIQEGTNRCFITTQNHGFAVGKIPRGFKPWFTNANDGSNEGLIHEKLPFMSVQFHPESTPGPYDTEWIFDYFLKKL
ncbi:glutamine-hydrolyzing carbamoyl-phosphate synthase small subunit [Candidatus Microgenomates bacterium]|nr:glutamine-hydrolyzing carbamoyl-phosphate synthase small subunit [Candidatus Microgenomates bacterium]